MTQPMFPKRIPRTQEEHERFFLQIIDFLNGLRLGYDWAKEGVTGGDLHDHNGGDGAQIDHTTLSNKGISTHDDIDTALTRLANTSGVNTGDQDLTPYVRKDGSITQITNRSHTDLTSIGTNTHSQIDTHISSTSNPHTTTLEQARTAGSTLAGDVNFAKYKAIAMCCDNGTSFPASPNPAQWFYRTDIDTLFIYEGAWQAIHSFAAVTLYVDATLGSDAVGQGYSSGAGACATIQYAINLIPPVNGGIVTIMVTGATYTESVSVQGKAFTGPYYIQIVGVMSSVLADTTATSGTSTTVTVTAAGWGVNAYQNKLIRITSGTGSGQQAIVKSNTADTITIVGTWAYSKEQPLGTDGLGTNVNNTSHFVIEDWATTWNKGATYPLYVLAGQQAIYVKNISIVGSTTLGCLCDIGSFVSFYGCKITGTRSVQTNNNSNALIRSCYAPGASTSLAIFRTFLANMTIMATSITGGTGTGAGVRCSGGAITLHTNFIDSNGGSGVYAERPSNIIFGATNIISNNGAWGVYLENEAIQTAVSSQTYSGNVTGTYIQYLDNGKIVIGAGTASPLNDFYVLGTAGFGGATHRSKFEADGTLVFENDATVWNDINISAMLMATAGATVPPLTAINASGIQGRAFTGTGVTAQEGWGSLEILHDYKEASDITPHVHWMPTTTGAGNVKWQLEYYWLNNGDTAGASTTITLTDAAGGTAWVERRASFAAITGTGKTIGSRFLFRLFRDPADGSDTYGDPALLLDVGIHYQIDTVGSRQITTK